MTSDLHRRTSHSPYHTSPEGPEPADLSTTTTDLAMASSVDDERPTAVDVKRLSSFWENRGTIHIMGENNTNQSETTVQEEPTFNEPSSPTKPRRSSHFWGLKSPNRPMHERTESTETTDSTASGSSQGSSGSSTVVDEKAFEANDIKQDKKGSATASVNEIEDINNSNNNSRRPSVQEPPYHVYTKKEKWLVTIIIAMAGLFSPLSSNIYFPALGAIADVSTLF